MSSPLKPLLFISLIVLPLFSMGQQHCISLDISRRLHYDARRAYYQDTLISEFESKIVVLTQQSQSSAKHWQDQLAIEREKNTLQSQNVEGFKSQILSYESENNYLKKRERKARRERNVAIGLGVILIALAVVK